MSGVDRAGKPAAAARALLQRASIAGAENAASSGAAPAGSGAGRASGSPAEGAAALEAGVARNEQVRAGWARFRGPGDAPADGAEPALADGERDALYARLLDGAAAANTASAAMAEGSGGAQSFAAGKTTSAPGPLPADASPVETLTTLEQNLAALPTTQERDAYIRENQAVIDRAVLQAGRGSDEEAFAAMSAATGAAELAGDDGRAAIAGSVVRAFEQDRPEDGGPAALSEENHRLLDGMTHAMQQGEGASLLATTGVALDARSDELGAQGDEPGSLFALEASQRVTGRVGDVLLEHRLEYEAASAEYFEYLRAFEEKAAAEGWTDEQKARAYAALEEGEGGAAYRAARDAYEEANAKYVMDLQGAGIVKDAERDLSPTLSGVVDESERALVHSATLVQTDFGTRVMAEIVARGGEGNHTVVDTIGKLEGGEAIVEELWAVGVKGVAAAEIAGKSDEAHRILRGLSAFAHSHPHLQQGLQEIEVLLDKIRGAAGSAERHAHLKELEDHVFRMVKEHGLPERVGQAFRGLGLTVAVIGGDDLAPNAGPLETLEHLAAQGAIAPDALAFAAEMFGRKGLGLTFSGVTGVFDAVSGTARAARHFENGNYWHGTASAVSAVSGGGAATIAALAAAGVISGGTALVVAGAVGVIGVAAGVFEEVVLDEAKDDEVKEALEVFEAGAEGVEN